MDDRVRVVSDEYGTRVFFSGNEITEYVKSAEWVHEAPNGPSLNLRLALHQNFEVDLDLPLTSSARPSHATGANIE